MTQQDMAGEIKKMMRLASSTEGLDALFDFGLDWVERLTPYDLTTIFLLEGDRLVVRAARGKLAGPKVMNHELALEKFPSLRRVLATRRARAFTEGDHAHGDGDPFDGVLDLPHGHACMVVPLAAGDKTLGVMTLDRAYCEPYSQTTVDLLEIYGQVLAMALYIGEQNDTLRRLHRDALAREKLLDNELRGNPVADSEGTQSQAMMRALHQARQVASTHTPVLILGETGTGKERMANFIHHFSSRNAEPFVKINCAAIPENLLESELFGHVKGAFTGATRNRPGRFQMANRGTILLDEIGEMPLALQAKLLRVLQEGSFEPVGSDRTVKVDVRILASTHVDLPEAIRTRRFREDLYYRLAVFPISVPPLRERLEDLPSLCESLLSELKARTGQRGFFLGTNGLAKLRRYHWPGNVRELGNVLERAAILARGAELSPDLLELPRTMETQVDQTANLSELREGPFLTLAESEKIHIKRALGLSKGKIYGKDGAASLLGLKPSTLQSRMKKLGLERKVVFNG